MTSYNCVVLLASLIRCRTVVVPVRTVTVGRLDVVVVGFASAVCFFF